MEMFPDHVIATRYSGVGGLPHFDDSSHVPEPVHEFREQVARADGILICQPEYAFGVAGSLKNALDWTVGSGDFVNKPVALITAATVGENAHAAMKLTLTAMNAILVEAAMLTIPFVKSRLAGGAIKEAQLTTQLQFVVTAFVRFIESYLPDKTR